MNVSFFFSLLESDPEAIFHSSPFDDFKLRPYKLQRCRECLNELVFKNYENAIQLMLKFASSPLFSRSLIKILYKLLTVFQEKIYAFS